MTTQSTPGPIGTDRPVVNPTAALSVVVPARDAASTIAASVRSITGQYRPVADVVVVDDGSTDDTGAVVAGLDGDLGVEVVRTGGVGVSAARNLGAARSTGDVLVFLDADDRLVPNATALFATALARGAELAVAGAILHQAGRTRVLPPPPPPGVVDRFPPGSFAVTRALFDAVGGYDPDLAFGENTDLAMRLLDLVESRGGDRVVIVPNPTVLVDRAPAGRRQATHDRARLHSVEVALDRHAERFAAEPRRRADQLATAAGAAHRLGDRRAARHHQLAACRTDPRRVRHHLRLGRLLAPLP